ncbi:glycosyltransferase family 2 protein [Megalodesulfovibrio paquesii]
MSQPLHCIIVHYGQPALTLECVRSLAGALDLVRPVVVCNSTQDEARSLATALTAQMTATMPHAQVACWDDARRDTADVLVLCTGGNPGFATACNLGLAEVARWHAQHGQATAYCWLLNNDAQADPEAPARLLAFLQAHPRCVAGTAVVRHDDPSRLEVALGSRYNMWTTKLYPQLPGAPLAGIPAEFTPQVDYIYGASLAFPLQLYQEIGGLDEQFFLYYEEHDFCRRARQHGWQLCWAREAVVRHRGGASAGLRQPRSAARAWSHYHENRSTLLFTRKHAPWALPVALVIRLGAKHVFLPLRGEAWMLPSLWAAVRDLLWPWSARAPQRGKGK